MKLIDADFGPIPLNQIVRVASQYAPDAVLLGHSGSTSAHPNVLRLAAALRRWLPHTIIVYGGVYPTYHWRKIMTEAPQIDIIVRGEGEQTVVNLLDALERGGGLHDVPGIVFRDPALSHHGDGIRANSLPPPIANLDDYRIGWELIDHSRYTYRGNRRAVVVQFSRGCLTPDLPQR